MDDEPEWVKEKIKSDKEGRKAWLWIIGFFVALILLRLLGAFDSCTDSSAPSNQEPFEYDPDPRSGSFVIAENALQPL